jgi:hypothetical protein
MPSREFFDRLRDTVSTVPTALSVPQAAARSMGIETIGTMITVIPMRAMVSVVGILVAIGVIISVGVAIVGITPVRVAIGPVPAITQVDPDAITGAGTAAEPNNHRRENQSAKRAAQIPFGNHRSSVRLAASKVRPGMAGNVLPKA